MYLLQKVWHMSSYKFRWIMMPLVVRTRMYKLPVRWLKRFNLYNAPYLVSNSLKRNIILRQIIQMLVLWCFIIQKWMSWIWMLFAYCLNSVQLCIRLLLLLIIAYSGSIRHYADNIYIMFLRKVYCCKYKSQKRGNTDQGIFLKTKDNLPFFYIKHGHFEYLCYSKNNL